jgi:uridine kinase
MNFPIQKIVKRDGRIVPYDRSRIFNAILKATGSVGKPDEQLAEKMTLKVEEALAGTYGSERLPSVEDIQDIVESVLMENHLTAIARNYIIYRYEHALARAEKQHKFDFADNVPYRKLYETLRWNIEHQCASVEELNRLISRRKFRDLVIESEKRFHKEIESAVEQILARGNEVKLIIVAGPSSSGKTTTTNKIAEQLKQHKLKIKTLNLDNYFFDLEKHPKDEFGDYDYETPEALDMELINQHLVELLDGKSVKIPYYNFKTGIRTLNAHEMHLEADELLLIDSLHGLYDVTTQSVPKQKKFKLYVETLGQLRTVDGTFVRWSDNRLIRRMVRDRRERNITALQTLTHWHYVRHSELNNIIPFIRKADYIINSSLPYELPILKPMVFEEISLAVRKYRNDPKRLDAHIRANRVYSLLKSIRAVKRTNIVPKDSILREFIGYE